MEESDIALLDMQAKEKGVSRADLVRDRLFSKTTVGKFTSADLSALVSRCYRTSNLPRSEVERLVHTVFVEVMSRPRAATSPDL
jgi:hypothetical protein